MREGDCRRKIRERINLHGNVDHTTVNCYNKYRYWHRNMKKWRNCVWNKERNFPPDWAFY